MRAVGWTAAAIGMAQVGAAAAVLTVDAVRKHRSPPSGDFPRGQTHTVEVAGNHLTVFTAGDETYEAMLAAIDAARTTVYFESYIWKGDTIGTRFKEALIRAAERGVLVCVVYDEFANLVVDPRFYRLPETVHVLKYRMFQWQMLTPNMRVWGRDHRKILVVDSEVGFVGGYNVGDLYGTSWRDTHVAVEGPAVWELEDAFVDFWNAYRKRDMPLLPEKGSHDWDARILSARNDPPRLLFPVRGLYLGAIERAVSHVWITQGYFIPDADIHSALLRAAARGVDVRIVVPEYSNHIIADWVARGYYESLLRGGVTIWLYRGAMVHAKTATVDSRWSTIGTANIDRLSMMGNFEVNLEIFSDDLAERMEQIFSIDLSNCHQLTLDDWQGRPGYVRVVEKLLSPFYPLL
ncbi:MAG: phospholipase D-like domain-containing protein [Dermatophilus congolensis]|nr:phospholipase D-like domain-containing protein [Dermatophilus congolensis]